MVFHVIELSKGEHGCNNEIRRYFPKGRYIFHGQIFVCNVNDFSKSFQQADFVSMGVHTHKCPSNEVYVMHTSWSGDHPKYALQLWDNFISHESDNNIFEFGPSEYIEFIPGKIEGPQLNYINESMKVFALISETVDPVI